MSSDVGVGDSEVGTLAVSPADGTTAVTLTVTGPDGTDIAVTMTAGALVEIPDTSPTEYSQVWTADTPVVYDQAGRWVLSYVVTGTGEGAEDLEVFVVASPVAGGPTWTPGRSRVANYVPHRTLARSTSSVIDSQDNYALTFDSTTRPSGQTCDRLIADGVAWVTGRVYPLHARLEPSAAVVVSLYCAAFIERSWPNDDQSLQRANDMERRLDVLLADLIEANNAANETGDFGIDVVPLWQFPEADSRWDYPTYW